MARATVEIFIDLSKYGEVLADRMAQGINTRVARFARQKVAVDTGQLRNSIKTDSSGFGQYETFAETPYALAQEYGRPDLPAYTFTPYMRPAAIQASQDAVVNEVLKEAEDAARRLGDI